MNQTITPCIATQKLLSGTLRVPSDRSITVRAAMLGSIANGTSRIREPLDCDDTHAALKCMADLGVMTAPLSSMCDPLGLQIPGVGLHGLRASSTALDCGSSGTTMRLLAGFLSGQRFASVIDGSDQLRKRPMRRVTEPLKAMGAAIADSEGLPPIRIGSAERPLHAHNYDMPIASAQVKSALLLAGLYAAGPVTIREPAPTRDHTERMLRSVGVDVQTQTHDNGTSDIILTPPNNPLKALDLLVPADFSSAAFFIVAASISPYADVQLVEVGLNPTRLGLFDALLAMGAHIAVTHAHIEGGEPVGDLHVTSSELHQTEIGGQMTARMIDEFPVFAVAATQAVGRTVVRDAQELRVKESNRLEGLVNELRKLGAKIEPTEDGFVIDGPTRLKGTLVDSLADHRVAMALAVAGLVADGQTTIAGAECVAKTYPGFWKDLASLM